VLSAERLGLSARRKRVGRVEDYLNDPEFVWIIHKHRVTGELLGPSVPFSIPTRVVYAILSDVGWLEVPYDERDKCGALSR